MAALSDRIRAVVRDGCFVVGRHAAARLRERRIALWQVQAGVEHARVVRERLDNEPDPVVEFQQVLADGTDVLVVWAWVESVETAKLVTVHYLRR